MVNGKRLGPTGRTSRSTAPRRSRAAYILVTSDSDVIVTREYLREVVPPMLDKKTGMLTCVYRGLATGGFWSLMDAIGMSVEMTAGVLVANLMEGMKFGLSPTLVLNREAHESIGGYTATGFCFFMTSSSATALRRTATTLSCRGTSSPT